MKNPSQLSLDLVAQSSAVAVAAQSPEHVDEKALLQAGSRSLALAARRAADKARAETHPVLELAPQASNAELQKARIKRATRRGKHVYLPVWSELAVGLPNALLRSSLWCAGETSDNWRENSEIATLGQDVRVLYTGRQLTQYDRRVLATCLDYYKQGVPLAEEGSPSWVCDTFYQFAKAMGLAYTLNTHKAIRASLIRLEAAALRVSTGLLELPVPRMLEVAFSDGYGVLPDNQLKGSDQIAFRVLEQFAALYGPSAWTAVPKESLGLKGLRAWLLGFYATHNSPRQLPFVTLQRLSGLTCRANDFRNNFVKVLTQLMDSKIESPLRVKGFVVSADKKSICVEFLHWTENRLA